MHRSATPGLPRSIWVVACASLASQVLALVDRGARDDDHVSLFVSVLLGALLVSWVSAGVVRARAIRLAVAWVVLLLGFVGGLIDLTSVDSANQPGLAVLSLAATAVALIGLGRFRRTDWYAWQRTRPSARDGAPIGRLVAIAVLVGTLSGMTGPVDDGIRMRVEVAHR